ncbi:hypothetical protein [Lentilactobacillus kisonensis]|uniref:Uncharacterized protein n=2 Tax=Lentilactobacillus kisonensis TaxID=481722 RepID=H1LFM7_9LACO|nr:hypothetical protein [Lentilactobacillus kisonensis]EHO51668.1 hypothetical protein HMPREF9104_01403 [Lentilactobacillus kisonensis F0435]KRL23110.1 hypothetical protein FC98_GL001148 [Lentilactobacillus kisonensis DSM 19906 = JCM 15041]
MKQAIYHATTASIWKKIRDNGFKIPENDWARFYVGNIKKKPGSLGYGVYGFLDDPGLATAFISKTTNLKDYAIIKMTIEVDDERVLNFVDSLDDMKLFRWFLLQTKLQRRIERFGKLYHNSFKQHSLDGALLEYFIMVLSKGGYLSEINCVRCATSTDLYKGIHLFIPNGIEYCIRDKDVIITYEMEN